MAEDTSLSGLSAQEAKAFHELFMRSFLIFTTIAFVAHILAWMWRPWLPGPGGYADAGALIDTTTQVAQHALTLLS